jgi:hypothetical protein
MKIREITDPQELLQAQIDEVHVGNLANAREDQKLPRHIEGRRASGSRITSGVKRIEGDKGGR